MSASGKRVAVLVEDGFEDAELSGPVSGLTAAGVRVTLVGRLRQPGSTRQTRTRQHLLGGGRRPAQR